jgi:hypothetical protein
LFVPKVVLMSDPALRALVAVVFLVVGIPIAALGLAFMFNVRGVGVRYVIWYRKNWAWTSGITSLHTPRGTRWVAAGIGTLWFICDGGVVALVVPALLK